MGLVNNRTMGAHRNTAVARRRAGLLVFATCTVQSPLPSLHVVLNLGCATSRPLPPPLDPKLGPIHLGLVLFAAQLVHGTFVQAALSIISRFIGKTLRNALYRLVRACWVAYVAGRYAILKAREATLVQEVSDCVGFGATARVSPPSRVLSHILNRMRPSDSISTIAGSGTVQSTR